MFDIMYVCDRFENWTAVTVGMQFCISTLLKKFIPAFFVVQSAVQCIQIQHSNLFIDLYLSCKIMYMFRLKSCHHQD